MSVTDYKLASGPGWSVSDIVCTAVRGERPFEEEHGRFCAAMVMQGTFRYRTRVGAAMMAPGGILLGNPGACFECGHDHGSGDRCLSFHFSPEFMEEVAREAPGVRKVGFDVARLPPMTELQSLLASAEAARDEADADALEETALRMAGAVVTLATSAPQSAPVLRAADERRVTEAVRRIELDAEGPLSLAQLAGEACTSRFHFLRTFRQVAGMTPYQFLLRTRLHRAAVRLRTSDDPISTIAFDAGFNDLSTFNRRFRKQMGTTPGAYRAERDRRSITR